MFAPFSRRLILDPVAAFSPRSRQNLAAWYDVSDRASMIIDGSNRVSLLADKSGNSAVNCLCLNGVAGNNASSPDSAALSIVGDIDVRSEAALDNWSAATFQVVAGNHVNPYTAGYELRIKNSGGIVQFVWGTGSSEITVDSTAAPVVNNYGKLQIRATLDVDNGSGGYTVTFYTRPVGSDLIDNNGWSQLGSAVIGASTTAIGNPAIAFMMGQREAGNTVAGRIYRVCVFNGIKRHAIL